MKTLFDGRETTLEAHLLLLFGGEEEQENQFLPLSRTKGGVVGLTIFFERPLAVVSSECGSNWESAVGGNRSTFFYWLSGVQTPSTHKRPVVTVIWSIPIFSINPRKKNICQKTAAASSSVCNTQDVSRESFVSSPPKSGKPKVLLNYS